MSVEFCCCCLFIKHTVSVGILTCRIIANSIWKSALFRLFIFTCKWYIERRKNTLVTVVGAIDNTIDDNDNDRRMSTKIENNGQWDTDKKRWNRRVEPHMQWWWRRRWWCWILQQNTILLIYLGNIRWIDSWYRIINRFQYTPFQRQYTQWKYGSCVIVSAWLPCNCVAAADLRNFVEN